MWPKFKSNSIRCLTKKTFISKLRILLRNNYISFFNTKNEKYIARMRDRNYFKTGLHTETGCLLREGIPGRHEPPLYRNEPLPYRSEPP